MRAHTCTHVGNSNFPGAEVCRIEPEPLVRKLHYSPSALWSVCIIIPSTTSVHIQMEFSTWQRVLRGMVSTRVWVGPCFISGKQWVHFHIPRSMHSSCVAVIRREITKCTFQGHIILRSELKVTLSVNMCFSLRTAPSQFTAFQLSRRLQSESSHNQVWKLC